MKLNFSDESYKEKALKSTGYGQVGGSRTAGDAFLQLIQGVSKEDLSNLCRKLQEDFRGEGELTLDACYDITQGNITGIDELVQKMKGKSTGEYLMALAYECIEKDGVHLGDKTINEGKINTSSWLSHSLYEAKVAQRLAEKMGLYSEKAAVLALFHDYGRKATHDFTHVVKGFEMLTDLGWEAEARACLTHSFINAGRCANCDPAEPGFYIDENGNPAWDNEEYIDDIAEVLNGMQYDEYDTILNIADLMATDKGITTPYDRVYDVATRKTPDPKNRSYFLSEFTNKLLEVMQSDAPRSNALMSIREADERFKKVSGVFYKFLYPEIEHESKKKKDNESLGEI